MAKHYRCYGTSGNGHRLPNATGATALCSFYQHVEHVTDATVRCSFYQHVEHAPEWSWGITWGHAVSEDSGATWRHLPDALHPTVNGADTSGCWSGCVATGAHGAPVALYTGVRLKGSRFEGVPTRPYAPGEPMVEAVMCARPGAEGVDGPWQPGVVVLPEPPDLGAPLLPSFSLLDAACLMMPTACSVPRALCSVLSYNEGI